MPHQSAELFSELRLRFISEGQQSAALLLQTPAESLDLATVKKIVHAWAGAGGMLGCPQITTQARIIEQLIREPFDGSRQSIWDALQTSHQVFTQWIEADSRSKAMEVLS